MMEAQDGALYTAMWGGAKEVFSLVGVEDFDPGDRQRLAEIIERGLLEQDPADLSQYCYDEALRLGSPSHVFVAQIMTSGFTASPKYYAEKVRQESATRYAVEVLTRGLSRLNSQESLPDDIAMEVKAELEAMPQPGNIEDDTWTLADIMGLEVPEDTFTIPKMLRKNERMVLTGKEGGGKSVFVYQMLTGAAFGVDTFTTDRYEPKRVLFLDVENNEFQAKNNLDKIVPTLRDIAPDVQPEWRSMKRRVVNLLETRDKSDVIRRIMHYAPDILYMGTAYKLTDVTDETHRAVRAIQGVVDKIRSELECSVIIEHHAGHGTMNDRNNMRPEGSSYWLRWPDFGYGMMPLQTDGPRLMRFTAWRGDRATDREFPVAVKQGPALPWVPVYADEWEVLYSDRYDK